MYKRDLGGLGRLPEQDVEQGDDNQFEREMISERTRDALPAHTGNQSSLQDSIKVLVALVCG